jgi:NAD(P)-dependent dehydrogenase (short-subunit alcohol dehydrogenase family)
MPPTNKATDLFNVNGLVAVITGGGSGLGLYAARALDANGAKAVYISSAAAKKPCSQPPRQQSTAPSNP